ncbi:MAG TPA: GDP-mannose 4,6-dehydratase [Spirochaetota bacterium]|nr:GDP-mannose 4,6-dehydratase [Spirochaetota bacterium]
MKILITGIRGFVGRHLEKTLLERGHEVYGCDTISVEDDSRHYRVDITDNTAVKNCIGHVRPDAIAHLAAISFVPSRDIQDIYRINSFGTLNLLRAASLISPMPRFLLISSSQVYGNVPAADQPIRESAQVEPVNHYGASKAAGESLARAFRAETGLPLVIARPFNHTGVGQPPHFVVPKIVDAFRRGADELSLGNTAVVRDFLDVRDVVNAYTMLLERFPEGKTFNIAVGRGYTIPEILAIASEKAGRYIAVRYDEGLVRRNDIMHAVGDSGPLRRETGWAPVHSLGDTIGWMMGVD